MKAHCKQALAAVVGFVVLSAVAFAGGRFLLLRKMGEGDLPLFAALFGFLSLLVAYPVFLFFSRGNDDRVAKLKASIEGIVSADKTRKIEWPEEDELKPIADQFNELAERLEASRKADEDKANRLKAFKTLCPDTLIIFRDDGEIIESFVRVREEILPSIQKLVAPGANVYDSKILLSQRERIRMGEIDETFARGKCFVTELSIRDAVGAIMCFETRICRLAPGVLMASCRDNTILHTAGLEHAAIQEKINQVQRTEDFGLIAGGLAHDYNNMLTAMQGNVELLLCEDISPEVRETVEDIKVAIGRSSKLVHKMLAHVCKGEPVEEKIDVEGLIANLMRLVRRSLPENAEVDFKSEANLPLIAADSVQVWQVVMNLVVNACDALHGHRGFVHVRTLTRKMDGPDFAPFKTAAALKPGLFVVLEVEDSGLGMDEGTCKRIFDPFFTTKPTGRGLGLASVASIVASCDGGIAVESEVGVGTTFRIIVPACLDEQGDPLYSSPDSAVPNQPPAGKPSRTETPKEDVAGRKPAVVAEKPSEPPARKKSAGGNRILVVDDDSSILKLLKIILAAGGYQATLASNGEEGLKVYEEADEEFDLALVDASMGTGMNGLDLCASIRAKNAVIPLILMSAYRAKEMSSKMASSGINGFLAKPYRSADVIDTINRYRVLGADAEGNANGAL